MIRRFILQARGLSTTTKFVNLSGNRLIYRFSQGNENEPEFEDDVEMSEEEKTMLDSLQEFSDGKTKKWVESGRKRRK